MHFWKLGILWKKNMDFKFEKGAGSKVDACGKKFVNSVKKSFTKWPKLHFKNTQKIGV